MTESWSNNETIHSLASSRNHTGNHTIDNVDNYVKGGNEMTFVIIIVYALVMFFLYNMFMNALGTADITWTDEDTGEQVTEERYVLSNQAMVQVLIALAWTGFSFWLVGKQMVDYMYYY